MTMTETETARPHLETNVPQFEQLSWWESPSTYIAIAAAIIPVLNVFVKFDASVAAQVVSLLAPLVAGSVLVVARIYHKTNLQVANAGIVAAGLAQQSALNGLYSAEHMDKFHTHVANLNTAQRAAVARKFFDLG